MQNLEGRVLLDRYRITRFIGRGGMAMVYEAWDEVRAAFVAIKLMHEDLAEDTVFLRRFAAEAATLARLDHPHIVRFLGFEEGRGLAFMVMEFVSGSPLRRQLSLLGRPLTAPEALGVLQPVCGALHYAHQMGIYHCDVKPANIFIDQGGRVILGDFGIARLSETATMTFSTPGTPAYMSPEQCQGAQQLDGRTDIYSLGVTAYEMLTLDRPFKGDTTSSEGSLVQRVRWEQINALPPAPRGTNPAIDPAVEEIILRALKKDPDQRYQQVAEFCAALQAAVISDVVMAPLADPFGETFLETSAIPLSSPSTQAFPARAATARAVGDQIAPTVLDKPVPLEAAVAPPKSNKRLLYLGGLVAVVGLISGFIYFRGVIGLPGAGEPGDNTLLVAVPAESPTPELDETPVVIIDPPPNQPPVPPTHTATAPSTATIAPTTTPTATATPSNVYVLYALNASNDMQDGEMAIAGQGLADHLERLDPSVNAGLLAYGHLFTAFEAAGCSKANVELRVPMRPGSAASIWESVTLLNPIGVAPVADALVDAHNYFSFSGENNNALIVITDGQSHCDEAADIWRRVQTRQNDSGQYLALHILGINLSDSEAAVYQTLAAELEGSSFQNVTDVTGLTEALDRLVGGLFGDKF